MKSFKPINFDMQTIRQTKINRIFFATKLMKILFNKAVLDNSFCWNKSWPLCIYIWLLLNN